MASQRSPTTAVEQTQPILTATGIEKTYGSRLPFRRDVEVLTGLDIEIYPGEIVGIVGGNGSGKSTLLKILVGTLNKDAGSITREGRIGWCPQETLLYDRLTVEETFRLFGTGYGLSEEMISSRMGQLADALAFEEYLDYRIEHLSGGNKQKVNLSIALLHEPDLLLLDEPYTGFDWETYLAFWELAEELVEQGVSIAIISHLVEEKERFDRIYELRDGRLSEQ